MPIALERRLKKQAKALHLGKKRSNAYVYGTMRRLGWKPSTQKRRKHTKHAKKR